MARSIPNIVVAIVFFNIVARAEIVSAFSQHGGGGGGGGLPRALARPAPVRVSSSCTAPTSHRPLLQVPRAASLLSPSSTMASGAASQPTNARRRRHHYVHCCSRLSEPAGEPQVGPAARGGVGGGRSETQRRKRDWRSRRRTTTPASRGHKRKEWPLRSSSRVSLPLEEADVEEGFGEGEVALAGDGGSSSSSSSDKSPSKKKQSFLKTLWDFSRPHTLIGTAVSIPAIGVFAGPPGVFPGARFFLCVLWALVPSLLINVYITGLNQITDVEIDKINKPYLPIPAGNLSPRAAKATVSFCLLAGVTLGLVPCTLGSPGLALTVMLSVLIGTCYSLPPVRLKRFPQVAALCILSVRGSLINGGFYSHAKMAGYGLAGEKSALRALTLPFRDAKCSLALAYFTVFAIVIALMKDVPDVAGDRKFNIPSFSVVLGEAKLFAFARRMQTTLLWSTAAALVVGAKKAAEASLPWTAAARGFVATAALVLGQQVRRWAAKIDPKKPDQVYGFYMDLWKIFYMSYLFLPLAR